VYCVKIPLAPSNKLRDGDTQRVLVDMRNITCVNPIALTTVQRPYLEAKSSDGKHSTITMKTAEVSYFRQYSIQFTQVKKVSKDVDKHTQYYRKLCAVDFRDANTILLEIEMLMGRRKRQEIYNIIVD